MALQRLFDMVSRFGFQGALLVSVAALSACGGEAFDDFEDVAEVAQGVGPTGGNDIDPGDVDSDPLKQSVTIAHGITSNSNPDPIQLCQGTPGATGCTLKSQWNAWLLDDVDHRDSIMKGIAKCAMASGYTLSASNGMTFVGQWGLYQNWKTNRLNGQDKRERVSSCILSLLNGNDESLKLCVIGPGGSPFSDPCTDPGIIRREGGFFGDLFATSPTAYVAGPDSDNPFNTGRVCTSNGGNYCCAEADTSCTHRIVLAGSILGSAAQNYADKRCNAALVNSGGFLYCPRFFSTREPNRPYTNVFTSFVPEIQ